MSLTLFENGAMVLHKGEGNKTFFLGKVVATYQSLCGVVRCVVETDRGLTYITDQANLERISFPVDKTIKKTLAKGGKY